MGDKNFKATLRALLISRRQRGCSEGWLEHLSYLGERAARYFGKRSVTPKRIEKFLASLPSQELATRRNYLRVIKQVLRYGARSTGKIIFLPFDDFLVADSEPGAWTPDELKKIFGQLTSEERPVAVLVAFCNLRQAEAQRAVLQKLNFERRRIVVAAKKAKTRKRRICPIPANALAWLKHDLPNGGKVWKGTRKAWSARFHRAVKRAGVPERRNGLRHSCISYRMAQTQNESLVALESGTSPKCIFGNYREVVTSEDAEGWFAIMPENQLQLRLAA